MPKLAAITAFVKVVETGSFTRAAEILGLPKARVSQLVSALELSLGVRLLQRTTRAIQLTEEGRACHLGCTKVLADIAEMEGLLGGHMLEPTGTVRIDSPAAVGRWIVAPQLSIFRQQHPGIQVQLMCTDRISQLLEEDIDCAVRGGELTDSTLVARHVADVTFGLYAAPGYLARVGPILGLEDLRRAERLTKAGGRANMGLAWQLQTPGGSVELEEPASLTFDDPDAMVKAALSGAGIAPAAPFAVASAVRQGLLVPVLPAWHFSPRPVHVVYPSRRHLSQRVSTVIEWTIQTLKDSATLRMLPADLTMLVPGKF